MSSILKPSFFNRPTLTVAKELIGKYLVMQQGDEQIALMIKEVEAYDGFEDVASHAFKGKTARTEVMFGPGGFWYVYFIYGMYWMLNIVTGPKDYPAAILIRAAGEFNGPGKLTKNLGIDKTFSSKPASPETGLWIEDRGMILNLKIKRTPRIGVAYSGPIWSKKLYRFVAEIKPSPSGRNSKS